MFEFDTRSAVVNGRERQYKVVRHPGGAAVLAVNDGRAVLVEQLRPALGRPVLELPAGMRDGDEDPYLCARRELQEETGFTAQHWSSLGSMLVSPGYSTEELFLFLAEDLQPGEQNLDDSEDIRLHWFDLDELRRRVKDGSIKDSKTVLALLRYWLDLKTPL